MFLMTMTNTSRTILYQRIREIKNTDKEAMESHRREQRLSEETIINRLEQSSRNNNLICKQSKEPNI